MAGGAGATPTASMMRWAVSVLGSLSQARKFVTLGVGGLVYHLVVGAPGPRRSWTRRTGRPGCWPRLLYDFCYYWLHRLGHERTLLWAAHVAHHQSEDYNLSTALRQTSTGFLLGWIFYMPDVRARHSRGGRGDHRRPEPDLPVLGAHAARSASWAGTSGSSSRRRTTACTTRRTTATSTATTGALFIIWDRLFGTFQEELEEDPPVFGIRGPLHSFSPLQVR
jgi:alkylglycerol monooxygenase